MKNAFALLICFIASFSAGGFGSQYKPGEWYASLQKPIWTPPSLAFPMAWTILYALMSIAAWLVWKHRAENSSVTTALLLFALQLILNAAWSWIFFGRHQMGWALVEMLGLWVVIAGMLYLFWKIDAMAGYLMIPYLAWVSFALVLNWAIWKMNINS